MHIHGKWDGWGYGYLAGMLAITFSIKNKASFLRFKIGRLQKFDYIFFLKNSRNGKKNVSLPIDNRSRKTAKHMKLIAGVSLYLKTKKKLPSSPKLHSLLEELTKTICTKKSLEDHNRWLWGKVCRSTWYMAHDHFSFLSNVIFDCSPFSCGRFFSCLVILKRDN